jgi:hypothetical protein
MLVIVVPEVFRGSSGRARNTGRRGPSRTAGQHDQQQVDEDASHEASVSSMERISTVAMYEVTGDAIW